MNNLKENLDNVSSRLRRACEAAGRAPGEVQLLAVSKKHPAEKIRELHGLGQPAFGENILREALAKQELLADLDIEWHFIGSIQSNKTRDIAENFDWAQSVDRAKILRRLSDQRPESMAPLNVCIQVNIDNEAQKGGCRPEEIAELARLAEGLGGIRLRGIMAIPKLYEESGETSRDSFRRLNELFEQCREAGLDFDTLSMGMSADMEHAIAAGSTMVRIGTDLFGRRPQ
jgi:pyridoxal phosphate enzyme (YggS family)